MSKLHWLALSMVAGVGGTTARRLAERFGGVEAVFSAEDDELLSVARVTPAIVEELRSLDFDIVERQMDSLAAAGVSLLAIDEDGYPANLLSAADAPALLYAVGDVLPEDEAAVAVVGTREPSAPSVDAARFLAEGLGERGITVISGLARGIDSAAHEGALEASSGRTIAVLGSGLNRIHPRENALLAERIAERGAVLSELAPHVPPQGPQLMARDRIISGLSLAVIVVEAGEKSGSVDTAAKARRQGRSVYALPGSPGTDALLRASAGLCEATPGFLDELAASLSAPPAPDAPTQLSLFDS
jgi:DNA processing protein